MTPAPIYNKKGNDFYVVLRSLALVVDMSCLFYLFLCPSLL